MEQCSFLRMRKGLRGLAAAGAPASEEILASFSLLYNDLRARRKPITYWFQLCRNQPSKALSSLDAPWFDPGTAKVPQNGEQEKAGNLDSVGILEVWNWDVGRTRLPLKFWEAPSLSLSLWRCLAILGIPSYEDSNLCLGHMALPLCVFSAFLLPL